MVVFRLGKVRRGGIKGPGLCVTLPCTDSNVLVDMRTGVHDVLKQDILTQDSVNLCVDAVVFYRVSDPLLAVCGDDNYNASTQFKAQSVIRNTLGTKTLGEILHEKEHMGAEMRASLQEGVSKIGVTIDRMELKHVGISVTMQSSMAKEAEAKVNSQAKWIHSHSEGETSKRLVEAGDDLSPVSIHLRYLQSMLKIHRPVEKDMVYIVPIPLEIARIVIAKDWKMHGNKNKMDKRVKNGKTTENVLRKRSRK